MHALCGSRKAWFGTKQWDENNPPGIRTRDGKPRLFGDDNELKWGTNVNVDFACKPKTPNVRLEKATLARPNLSYVDVHNMFRTLSPAPAHATVHAAPPCVLRIRSPRLRLAACMRQAKTIF